MAKLAKFLQGVAGAAGAGGLNVEDVFSTYLYTGNGSTQTITNGIDLDGEGGLVWIKIRNATESNNLVDTERGDQYRLISNNTNGSVADVDFGTFTSSGFTLDGNNQMNFNGYEHVSWTFRKAPKFFDIVQYSGDNTTSRQISHNLGAAPAVIIVKCTNTTGNWVVYHKDLSRDGTTVDSNNLVLNANYSESGQGAFGDDQYQTSTYFTLGRLGSGFNDAFNKSGNTYVAYLFAHNDGDGDFGPTGDQDIIKCGSYAGNGSTDGPEINLGFEPQFIMVKKHIGGTGNWFVFDAMRGLNVGSADIALRWNDLAVETNVYGDIFSITPTGFKLVTTSGTFNDAVDEYIYIAIRRGPMAVPESATDVFAIDAGNSPTSTAPEYTSNFPVDMAFYRDVTGTMDTRLSSRLTGNKYLRTNLTNAETGLTGVEFDYMDGYFNGALGSNYYAWMWRRAPNFFDVVAYKGNLSDTDREHNLGVVPEMIIIKNRTSAQSWAVYHSGVGVNGYLLLTNAAAYSGSSLWNNTAPTDTTFSIASVAINAVNNNTDNYIAYLFASLDGVSKVGSYTGNGTSQTIDCGFSSGARFVLIKRTDSTGDWYIWDTERGIVAANDPHLSLNTTAAQVTTDDSIDPVSSGFAVNQVAATNINVSSASYIFYAIA